MNNFKIWVCAPARRDEPESTLSEWTQRGYGVAVCREPQLGPLPAADLIVPTPQYLGWARSCNMLAQIVLAADPTCEWVVFPGDDTLPDPKASPGDIAWALGKHFNRGTWGVCQPTGDPWSDSRGRIIERVAGSPFVGREFALRMYGGAGPLWPGWYHNWADEELQNVAMKLGVFWQNAELMHFHRHWHRQGYGMPNWAARANDPEQWAPQQRIFDLRRQAGFPGHQPIPMEHFLHGKQD